MSAKNGRNTGKSSRQRGQSVQSGQTAAGTAQARAEKRRTAYLFSCAGGMLWVVPALSSLAIGILSDGMSVGFGLAIAALLLGIPNSLFAISAYKKKSGRPAVIALDLVLTALHIAAAVFIRTWAVILAPAAVLLLVMAAVSDVIVNH